MWTKLLKTGFNNIEMSKDFNYNMSSYVFSREDNYNGSLIVKILFFFQPLDIRIVKVRILCNLTFLT